jgi:hypothetical protein
VIADIRPGAFHDIFDTVIAISGDEDDLCLPVDAAQLLHGFNAIPTGHAHIHEYGRVGAAGFTGRQPCL